MIHKRGHVFESESLYTIYLQRFRFKGFSQNIPFTVPLGLIACLIRIHHKLAQTGIKAAQQPITQQSPGYLLVLYSSLIQNFRH